MADENITGAHRVKSVYVALPMHVCSNCGIIIISSSSSSSSSSSCSSGSSQDAIFASRNDRKKGQGGEV